MRRVSQIEGTIHKGCVFFVPYPEKNALFLHFFFLTPAFWEFKAVILQRKTKKRCLTTKKTTFTAEDKKWIHRSITSSLEDIASHLEELESLGGNIDSLSFELSTIHSLLQERE